MTLRWKKSSRSGQNTDCVEIANTLGAVRDSKNPTGPVMTIGQHHLTTFLAAAKSGRFDT